MLYQPIVRWSDRTVFSHEALVRSDERQMPHPGALFDAAERLSRLDDLGRRIRDVAPRPLADTDGLLFVNLHTADLGDEQLYDPDSPMARYADRIVLEITERASLDRVTDVAGRIARLRKMGFRIALDDLGAGYAGLTAFSLLEPDVVKLDMSIVRDVHRSSTQQALIKSMATLCGDMGIQLVTEGIENVEERDCLISLGCDLFQGFFFARPAPPFPEVNWS